MEREKSLKKMISIAVGGAAGVLLRDGLRSVPIPGGETYRPLITMGINIIGSFLLGFLLILFVKTIRVSTSVRTGLTTGFLGGFTTFSTFCKESVFYAIKAGAAAFVLYTAGSVLLGLLAAHFGIEAGRFLERRFES